MDRRSQGTFVSLNRIADWIGQLEPPPMFFALFCGRGKPAGATARATWVPGQLGPDTRRYAPWNDGPLCGVP
jgi:hypothetical protein